MKNQKRNQGKNHGRKENMSPGTTGKSISQSPDEFNRLLRQIEEERRRKLTPQKHIASPREKPQRTTRQYKNSYFVSEEGIRVAIKYLTQPNEPPVVVVHPHAKEHYTYSCVIKVTDGKPTYKIKKYSTDGNNFSIFLSERFNDLYNAEWIHKKRLAQIELHAVEKAIGTEQKNIESRLGITLF